MNSSSGGYRIGDTKTPNPPKSLKSETEFNQIPIELIDQLLNLAFIMAGTSQTPVQQLPLLVEIQSALLLVEAALVIRLA